MNTVYRSILKVRPNGHPLCGWQFGWLVVFIYAPSMEAAQRRAASITDNLPYDVVETFGEDPLVGTLAVDRADELSPPPPELADDFKKAAESARTIGIGFVVVPAKEGLDEQDFTTQIRRRGPTRPEDFRL